MAPGNDGGPRLMAPKRRKIATLQALALTLAVHAAVLWLLGLPSGARELPPARFAEVELLEEPFEPVRMRTLEETLREAMEGRVANVRADASKERIAERVQSGDRAMAEAVEAELRAFEAAEMARLASEEKEFGLEGVPEVDESDVETLAGWDAQYEGNVTVAFDVPGRRAKRLDVPGYRCRGGARVVVRVVVNEVGEVRAAEVEGDLAQTLDPCFIESALKSARASTFYIDAQHRSATAGTLTYVFVPQ